MWYNFDKCQPKYFPLSLENSRFAEQPRTVRRCCPTVSNVTVNRFQTQCRFFCKQTAVNVKFRSIFFRYSLIRSIKWTDLHARVCCVRLRSWTRLITANAKQQGSLPFDKTAYLTSQTIQVITFYKTSVRKGNVSRIANISRKGYVLTRRRKSLRTGVFRHVSWDRLKTCTVHLR